MFWEERMATHVRRNGISTAVAGGLLALTVLAQPTAGSAADFGKPGDPVNLVVGYQPYYTESWSGVVMLECLGRGRRRPPRARTRPAGRRRGRRL